MATRTKAQLEKELQEVTEERDRLRAAISEFLLFMTEEHLGTCSAAIATLQRELHPPRSDEEY